MKTFLHSIKINKGFSLVEILVVLGLFSSIATLSLGALLNAQTINTRLQETQSIIDNVNLSSQTIVREIRFGSEFHCASILPETLTVIPTKRQNCPYGTTGGTVLIFKPADAENDLDRVAYYATSGILYKDQYINDGVHSTSTVLQMTSDDVNVKSLLFYVDGAQTSDGSNDENGAIDYKQPLVTILLSGATRPTGKNSPPASFDLETAVSSREIDNR